MRPQREFVFPDVSLGGYVVAESRLGREQMIITGEKQGDKIIQPVCWEVRFHT